MWRITEVWVRQRCTGEKGVVLGVQRYDLLGILPLTSGLADNCFIRQEVRKICSRDTEIIEHWTKVLRPIYIFLQSQLPQFL